VYKVQSNKSAVRDLGCGGVVVCAGWTWEVRAEGVLQSDMQVMMLPQGVHAIAKGGVPVRVGGGGR